MEGGFGAEVEEKTNLVFRGAKKVQELTGIFAIQSLRRLHLENDAIIDDEVGLVSCDDSSLVHDVGRHLPAHGMSAQLQLECESLSVGLLQQSKPERVVHLIEASDDGLGQLPLEESVPETCFQRLGCLFRVHSRNPPFRNGFP